GPALLAESVVRAMATTRLATACGAILLATGLTLAVGLGTTGPDADGPVAVAAQTGQPPAKGADQKDPKPPDKHSTLQKQADAIASRIEQLQTRLAREMPEDGVLDVSVLQSELFEVGKQILAAEKEVKTRERSLANALENKETAPTRELDKNSVLNRIDRLPGVQEAARRVNTAENRVASVERGGLGAEHP